MSSPGVSVESSPWRQLAHEGIRDHAAAGERARGVEKQLSSRLFCELASAEGNDAANRIVGGDANGHSIPGNHFDAKAAHPAAQLGQDLVS